MHENEAVIGLSGSAPRADDGCRRPANLLAGALLLGCGVFLGYEAITWPDVSLLARHDPQTFAALEIYAAGEQTAANGPPARYHWVSYPRISPHLKRAILVAEDINFFSHHGFDTAELQTAIKEAVEQRKSPRGASTLTQQFTRQMWLNSNRSWFRKFKEMLLTIEVEHRLSKKRIFELQLNLADFGPGIFGAEAAARYYFHRSAAELDETEGAELAAGLSRPQFWNPASSDPAYSARVRLILRHMEKAQFLEKLI